MHISHCWLPSTVGGLFQVKSKNRGIVAIWAISSAGKSEILLCESLMIRMRRRKHKVVTNRHRHGVEAIPNADNFHDTLPLELAGRADRPASTQRPGVSCSIVFGRQPVHFYIAAQRGASVAFGPR